MPLLRLSDETRKNDARLRVFSSMTDAELKDPKQLVGLRLALEKQGYPNPESVEDGLFIAESHNVIERALNAGLQPFCLIVEERWEAQTENLLERIEREHGSVPLFVGSHEQVCAVTGLQRTRGALAAFRRPKPIPLTTLLDGAKRIAILEDVTNFTNIGAIFRSAAALGMDAVLVTPGCHDPLYRRASRVAMGTVFQIPWGYIGTDVNWAPQAIPELKKLGFACAAFALEEDSVALGNAELASQEKLALILGTEGEGLRKETISLCNYTVKIPMDHGVDSLNVAAAAAVSFWELRAR